MRLLWFTGLAAVLLFVGLAVYLSPLEPGVLALQFAFTPKAFALVVHARPVEHLQRYRLHLPIDFLLLGCYGAFGHLLATRTSLFHSYPPGARKLVALTVPLAAAFDAVENALHLWLTSAPRFGVAPLYLISASSSVLKWLLLLAFGLAVIHAFARNGG